ncbi:ABC transporter substrate-binding protein [Paenibacillus luteus]|uniref:ABC transporter substrate-binding protein n=1 Tax=Paenibacillus luteus TaxID=2545753 RepID=UPI001375EFB0|nr:ABC transporter substrate-binding protein [Paenibacillus luteus]
MNKLRQSTAIILLLSALIFVYGCSNNSGTNTPTQSPGNEAPAATDTTDKPGATELKYALGQAVSTLDPHLSVGGSNGAVILNIFEGLYAFNSKLEPVPMLAESTDVSEDGKTYTFHLRQGIKFHNGKEMKGEDVAASLNRWKDKAPRAKNSFGDSSFEVVNDYTVALKLTAPQNDTLAQLSHVLNFAAIMPKEVVDSAAPEGITEYIGTGPYKFVEWKKDQYIDVEKFADYQSQGSEPDGFSGKKIPQIEKLRFSLVTDTSTRFNSFLTGEYNFVDIDLDNLPQVEGQPGIEIIKSISSDYNLVYNKKSPVFSILTNRQAVNTALKVDDILLGTVSTPELFELNSSYMFKNNTTWYSDAGSDQYNLNNPEKAKELLKQSGYDGREIVFLTTKDLGGKFYNATLVVQAQLENIGFKTRVDTYDYATMLTKRADAGVWDIYVGGFTVPTTPSQLLYFNPTYGFADDAKLAELLRASTSAITPEAVKAANDALQQYAWEYLAVSKIGDTFTYYAIRDELQGLILYAGYPNLGNVKVLKS